MWFFCPICVPKKKLKSKNNYVKHVDTHYTTSRKAQYPCPVCQISFKSRTGFFLHVKVHDGNQGNLLRGIDNKTIL